MKKLMSLLIVMTFLGFAGCRATQTTLFPGYQDSYVSSSVNFNDSEPVWSYAKYNFIDSDWYGGTPNYYNTSIYSSDL